MHMRPILLAVLLGLPQTLLAGEREAVESILDSGRPVKGVVFEIMGGDAASLKRAIIRTRGYVYQLRGMNKDIKLAVLSRGLEQFSLLKHTAEENHKLHKQVQKLVKNLNVPVQVCGRFAGMNDVESKEFLDIVEVVDSAPVQLETYRYNGYQIIQMDFDE